MIDPNLISQIEGHINTGAVLSGIIVVGRYWLKERDVYKRVKDRLNDLWWDRCGQRQEGYTPVDNGVSAVVPPLQHHGD
jgi:hypothetical protein